MEEVLLYGACMFGALTLGGGRVLLARLRVSHARTALEDALTDDGTVRVLSTQVSHGGMELATESAGRSLTLQLMPNHWQFHAFDIGVDPTLYLDLHVGSATGSSDDVIVRSQASRRVQDCVESIFRDYWVVEYCGIREGALVVAADTQQPFWEVTIDTVQRRFDLVARLAESLRTALNLQGTAELCPICPGQQLSPRVGHLLESVCSYCQGRFLSWDAVEQLVAELGISVGELKERIGQTRSHACCACRTKLAPVALGDAIAELCPGCGGMWLDSGELAALTLGRFEEIASHQAA